VNPFLGFGMAPELYRRTPVPLDRDNSPYGGASHNMPPSGQFFQRLLGGCEGWKYRPLPVWIRLAIIWKVYLCLTDLKSAE